MKGQKELQLVLLTVTLVMTGMFGWSLATGIAAILFAVTLVALQAGALLYVPAMAHQAWKDEQIIPAVIYGVAVALVLLTSVTASVATLSHSEDKQLVAQQERATLQAAVDGYMAEGFITKGLAVKKQLDQLPVVEKTALQSAAERVSNVTGWNGNSVISGFIVTLALLLDAFVIILGIQQKQPVIERTHKQTLNEEPVINQEPDPLMVEERKDPEPALIELQPEVKTVLSALDAGEIKKLTVKEVRELLSCGQKKAQEVSQICKQLKLQLDDRMMSMNSSI